MTNTNALWALTICGTLLMAGCASNGGSGSSGQPSFSDLQSDAQSDFQATASLSETATMPTSGNADYEGTALIVMDIAGETGETLYGSSEFTANFSSSAMTGQVDDIVGETVGDVSGALNVSGGTITGNKIAGQMDGDLTAKGTTAQVTSTISGKFVGSDADAIEASAAGTNGSGGAFTATISALK